MIFCRDITRKNNKNRTKTDDNADKIKTDIL